MFSPLQIGVMTGIALLVGVVYFQLGSMQFDNLGKNVSDRCVQHAHRTSLMTMNLTMGYMAIVTAT